MKTAAQRLADRIDAALRRGDRRFTIEGSEMDWVIDAIRAQRTDGQHVGDGK